MTHSNHSRPTTLPRAPRTASALIVLALTVGGGLTACSTSNEGSSTANRPEQPQEIIATAHERSDDIENEADGRPASAGQSVEEAVVTGQAMKHRARQDMAAQYNPHPMLSVMPPPYRDVQPRPLDREQYPDADDNPVKLVAESPVSTFSIDVDTAAYANMRRQLNGGALPHADSVRVEELINYFSYSYPQPRNSRDAFSVYTEAGPSPWHDDRKLLHIGVQGVDIDRADLPPANLVFLIDVSGSMQSANKIALLKPAMKMLVKQMREEDSIAIAVYAGAAGTVLEPTSGKDKAKIMAAIDGLRPGGSTNGAAGIQLAYDLANQSMVDDGINRVILATDGDFNVGTTSLDALKQLVEKERESGVSLSVLGFGAGNTNDSIMQELAQNGNGNAAYIDNLNEARKVLVEEMSSTLKTIAKDVKIQVEFNPAVVSEYRLVGYETRHLEREDFNNDAVDAGEIGAGHSVTALYELTLVGDKGQIDPLRYGASRPEQTRVAGHSDELAFVRLRYKQPGGSVSSLQEFPVKHSAIETRLSETSQTYRFSAAVAAFGQRLRGGKYVTDMAFDAIADLATDAKGNDRFGYRSEFVNLVRTAGVLGDSLAASEHNETEREDAS